MVQDIITHFKDGMELIHFPEAVTNREAAAKIRQLEIKAINTMQNQLLGDLAKVSESIAHDSHGQQVQKMALVKRDVKWVNNVTHEAIREANRNNESKKDNSKGSEAEEPVYHMSPEMAAVGDGKTYPSKTGYAFNQLVQASNGGNMDGR